MDKPKTSKELSYESYCRLRSGSNPALHVYNLWKEETVALDKLDHWSSLHRILVATATAIVTVFKYMKSNYIKDHKVWVTSPSRKSTKQLPLHVALRVIRKRGWEFTEVEPKKEITRREAASILILGKRSPKGGGIDGRT